MSTTRRRGPSDNGSEVTSSLRTLPYESLCSVDRDIVDRVLELCRPGGSRSAPELAVLQRRVGTWRTVNTIKPRPWVPKGSHVQSIETIRWILGHAFIEGNRRDIDAPFTATHVMGYDPASKSYRMWY